MKRPLTLGFTLRDELSDLGIGADRLDQDDLVRVQIHLVWRVEFLSPLYQDVGRLLRLWIHTALHVVDIAQHRELRDTGCRTDAIPGTSGEAHQTCPPDRYRGGEGRKVPALPA